MKILDGTALYGFDIAMPFTSAFSASLQESTVLIVPQHGWGWRQMTSSGVIDIEDIPQHGILIRVTSFVAARENEVAGFYGVLTDPNLIDGGPVVLCLLHTCDVIDLGVCPPVSIHCSVEKVPVVEEGLAPCGLLPVWDGIIGVMGWGQMVTDVAQPVCG